ncbi:MAG: phage virion morphogenesis protein [Desulfobacterales bacterium]
MAAEVIFNDKAVQEKLKELAGKLRDMSPVMADIADDLARSVEDNFLAGGRPKWKSLKSSTKAVIPIRY